MDTEQLELQMRRLLAAEIGRDRDHLEMLFKRTIWALSLVIVLAGALFVYFFGKSKSDLEAQIAAGVRTEVIRLRVNDETRKIFEAERDAFILQEVDKLKREIGIIAEDLVTNTASNAVKEALAGQLPSGASLAPLVETAVKNIAFSGAKGSVVAFSLSECPAGWRVFEEGQGRYIVGLTVGGNLKAIVGSALKDVENRPVGQHFHQYNRFNLGGSAKSREDAIAWGGVGSAMRIRSPESVSSAGEVEGTNAPYVQLLLCEKS